MSRRKPRAGSLRGELVVGGDDHALESGRGAEAGRCRGLERARPRDDGGGRQHVRTFHAAIDKMTAGLAGGRRDPRLRPAPGCSTTRRRTFECFHLPPTPTASAVCVAASIAMPSCHCGGRRPSPPTSGRSLPRPAHGRSRAAMSRRSASSARLSRRPRVGNGAWSWQVPHERLNRISDARREYETVVSRR